MTRFHAILGLAVIYGAFAFWWHSWLLLVAIILAVIVMMGLGVALPQLSFFGRFICRGSRSRPHVALTFDDGPDPRSTPRLLEILREANVRAAFFCIGKNIEAHPELAAQIAREGHLLENHTYSHSYCTNLFSSARLHLELERTQSLIQKNSGATPKYFRPPVGLSNPRIFRVARALQMQVIGWSIRSLDTVIADPRRVLARITARLEPGAIILLHDGNIPVARVEATVKTLLDTLRTLDYEVVRLDEILK
jgi:peptidoglycan/xylan/chitin deacetylase (PgdA/CDA1 family)